MAEANPPDMSLERGSSGPVCGERSDEAEHAKADGEHDGREQADGLSEGPDLGAKAGRSRICGEGVREPGFEPGKVGFRGECLLVGGSLADRAGGGIGLETLDPDRFELAGGGKDVEVAARSQGRLAAAISLYVSARWRVLKRPRIYSVVTPW